MEIELKLALDARHAPRLRRHPALSGAKPLRRRLHSVYFDTPDFALMGRAVAFRLRRVGYHWVQTLKAEARAVGALSTRPEWEMAVAGSEPDFAVLPAEAMALLEGIDLARLAPVFVTEFQRTTWQVQADGCVAELALDLGDIRAGPARQGIAEVEVELKSGPARGLFALAGKLLESVPLRVEPRSKAERGYQLCEAARPAPTGAVRPDIRAGQAALGAWQGVVGAALAQVVANVPGFLERPEETEYLHQLRIALRRLRAAAGLAGSLGLARPAWSGALAGIMDGLNPARDWDVFLHETLPAAEIVLDDPPLGQELGRRVRQAARAARQSAQALVAGPAFTRLVLDVGASLHAEAGDGRRAGDWAASLLEKRWKRLRRLGAGLQGGQPAALHAARIAAKKLRYAADAFSGLYGKRGKRFIGRLADLQDCLGRANDAVVARSLLDGVRRDSPALDHDAGRIAGVMAERLAHQNPACRRVWRRLAESRPFWG